MTRILFVCTGNLCRSPTAAALLAAALEGTGESVEVNSAGLLQSGLAVPGEVVEAGRALGVDLEGHRSHRLTDQDVADADLILGMAREHVREIVALDHPMWPKTFTLLEVLRRGHKIGARRPHEQLGSWIEQVHLGRRPMDLLGVSHEDDIADPMGGPPDGYRESAAEIARAVNQLSGLLWTPAAR